MIMLDLFWIVLVVSKLMELVGLKLETNLFFLVNAGLVLDYAGLVTINGIGWFESGGSSS